MGEATEATAVDVVIVGAGAGPTGLTAAHLCRRLGLSAVVLEKRTGPQRSPAAHAVNARTFEIWRQAGLDMKPILDAALAPQEAGMVRWVTKLGGELIASLPYERQGDEMLAITPDAAAQPQPAPARAAAARTRARRSLPTQLRRRSRQRRRGRH